MEFELKNLPKSEVEIVVKLTFQELEPYLQKAASLISEEIKIEGFRPGKAPYEIVKNKIGEMAIYEKAAEVAVQKTYPEIMMEIINKNPVFASRPPIGHPEITVTKLALGNELQYKIKQAVLPEIKLPDYKEIARRARKEKKEISVGDEEVEKSIDWLRESHAKLITVSRPAQKGDRVEINFEASENGVKLEGVESKNHPLIIGQGKFLPGFEDQLIDAKTGEEKNFSLTVPENWRDEVLRGKTLDFKTTVNLAQERVLPEANDEFAQSLGNFPSIENLKRSIRGKNLSEKEAKEKERIRVLIIEEIAKNLEAEIPQILIDGELEKMLEELKSGLNQMGMKWEDYLTHLKKTVEDLKKDWAGEAEKRVKIALCLKEIAAAENIEASDEEIKSRADEILRHYKTAEQTEKSIDSEELKIYTKGVIRNEKVFEFLEGLA